MPDGRPNVVLLFTDEQRFDTVAAAGYPHMRTPNLDRLAREGGLFRRAYSPNPVCVPARHNLITGLPARYHGFSTNAGPPMDESLPVLPRILSDHGYETRAIGKMHFRPPRRHHGFDRMELMEELPRFREWDDYAMYLKRVGLGHVVNIHGCRNLLYVQPQRSLLPEKHHGSTWVGERSAAFIRENRGQRPFFLWSSWIAPHPPFDVPDSFADLYADTDLPAPLRSETPIHPKAALRTGHGNLPARGAHARLRRIRELYYAQVSLVDKNVGRILDALEETGQIDNTLILFTSDHGEMLGDFGTWLKALPYDGAARIPFLVRYPPRMQAGTVRDDFADLNDILPTVLDATGLSYPGARALPGGSVFRDDKDRTIQYIEHGAAEGRFITLLDERYKYSYYYGGGTEELFDCVEDPHETVNLLCARPEDPQVRAARDRLASRLVQVEARWGLRNYVTGGRLLRLPEPGVFRALRGEAPPPPPARNKQFQTFHTRLRDPQERAAMNSLEREVIEAVRREPTVRLCNLDLDAWASAGVPDRTIDRIRRDGL